MSDEIIPPLMASTDNSVEFRLYAKTGGMLKTFGFDQNFCLDESTVFRMETACSEGDEISGVYDGMLARFILKHPGNSLDQLKSILLNFHIEGVEHNLPDLYLLNE